MLLNVALAFCLVSCIWAYEVDIFRSWQLLNADTFQACRRRIGV
jgi:hypothetical protein